jgi:putative transposase
MRKSKFTEEQMVRIVRETDKATVTDVAKKYGISDQTLYIWKRRLGGVDADDAKRLRALEVENGKLRRMLADRLLELELMKEINAKNGERARPTAAGRASSEARRVAASRVLARRRGAIGSAL